MLTSILFSSDKVKEQFMAVCTKESIEPFNKMTPGDRFAQCLDRVDYAICRYICNKIDCTMRYMDVEAGTGDIHVGGTETGSWVKHGDFVAGTGDYSKTDLYERVYRKTQKHVADVMVETYSFRA